MCPVGPASLTKRQGASQDRCKLGFTCFVTGNSTQAATWDFEALMAEVMRAAAMGIRAKQQNVLFLPR